MRNIVRNVTILLVLTTLFSCNYHHTEDKQPRKEETDSVTSIPQTDTIAKLDSITSKTELEEKPDVAGDTKHIMTIMRSIANGDAKELASLTIFPIERKYPLRDIKDSRDLMPTTS